MLPVLELLDSVREVACRAGDEILRAVEEGLRSDVKQDGSPVTNADRASHRAIQSALLSLDTGWPIISEEGASESPTAARKCYWLVDPLDGTREFQEGLGDYTVNIALVEAGEPRMGVVHAPAAGLTYCGAIGLGAWLETEDAVSPLPRSDRTGRPAAAVISRSHASEEVLTLLQDLGVETIVRRGSSLKICTVAEGEADVYPRLGPTYPWDTAAGAAVARAAGCSVCDLAGQDLDYSRPFVKHAGFIVYRKDGRIAPILRQRWESEQRL